ncbi:Hypothetical predicted protein, partial [Paramuricea clavata]
VIITKAGKGHFTFHVAPLVNAPTTQDELNQHVLTLTDGQDRRISRPVGTHIINLKLPTGFVCDHCVLQWR